MPRLAIACLAVLLFGNLAACTKRQMYESGQAYQRNQCNQMRDGEERQRCLDKANVSYDQYKKETETLGR